MIPVIQWELARRRMYLIWWCVGTTALVTLLMLVYPSIHHEAAQFSQVYQSLPESIRGFRGGSGDITSPVGYLNGELYYITLPLLFIIMTVTLGSSILARDEQDRTLELLLARPVSRTRLLLAKALAGITAVVIVGGVSTAVTLVLARAVNIDMGSSKLLLASVFALLFSTSFGAVAFALSAASRLSRKAGVAIAVGASFGGYLLQSLSGVSDWIEKPAKLLPYHYYTPDQILQGNISRGLIVHLAGIFVVCAFVSWLGFRRRDIG